MIERWSEIMPGLTGLLDIARTSDLGRISIGHADFGPPLPSPNARIFALGGNFSDHVAAASKVVYGEGSPVHQAVLQRREQGPWGFLTLPDTVIGHGATVRPPPDLQKVDYEGEVAVILASGGRRLRAEEISIWGFTAWNDFSLRDAALGTGPKYDGGPMTWTLQKNFDTGSSGGPWVVVVDGGETAHDVAMLSIETRVNGEVRQRGSTAQMVFSFAETAEHLAQFVTLRPGDMIASGTPAGTALEFGVDGPFLRHGDVTEVEVDGVGVLRNIIDKAGVGSE
jgi:2-keto-4-pentenoate hydratase/2-oxohepta-3-ene-1,7-dioic acid hydratase in catechol pathway